MSSSTRYSNAFFVAGLVVAIMAFVPATHGLLTEGPFQWHVSQARFIQGGIELLLLGLTTFIGIQRGRQTGFVVGALCSAFLARRLAIDLAVLSSAIYASGILATGALIESLLDKGHTGRRALAERAASWAVLGVIGFACAYWLLLAASGARFHAAVYLGWLLSVTALGICAFRWRRNIKALTGWLREEPSSKPERLLLGGAVVLLFTFLAIVAKGSLSLDSDSAWYGLRPDRVLFAAGSIMDPPGLGHHVYYYPKLYELLITPLSDIGGPSTVIAFTATTWLCFFCATLTLARDHIANRPVAWAISLIVATTPAMSASAVSAKGDLLAATFLVAGMTALLRYWRHGDARSWAIAAIAALIAPQLRLSVLPYALAEFAVLLGITAWHFRPGRQAADAPTFRQRRWLWLLLPALVLIGLSLWRTYLLTGVPLISPGEVQRFFLAHGFNLRFPAGVSPDRSGLSPPPFLSLLWDFLVAPQRLDIVRIRWPGVMWALLLVSAIAVQISGRLRGTRKPGEWVAPGILLAVGSLFLLIIARQAFATPGGGGNYFIAPITFLCVGAGVLLQRLPARLFAGVTSAAMIAGSTIFLFSAVWWPGTRSFDLELDRNPFELRQELEPMLRGQSTWEVYEATSTCKRWVKAIGVLPLPAGYLLRPQFEPLKDILRSRRGQSKEEVDIADYLRRAGTHLVVVPDEAARGLKPFDHRIALQLGNVMQELESTGDARQIGHRDNYRYWWLGNEEPCVAGDLPGKSGAQE